MTDHEQDMGSWRLPGIFYRDVQVGDILLTDVPFDIHGVALDHRVEEANKAWLMKNNSIQTDKLGGIEDKAENDA